MWSNCSEVHFHDCPAIRHVLKPRVYDPARVEPDFGSPVLLCSRATSLAQRLLSNWGLLGPGGYWLRLWQKTAPKSPSLCGIETALEHASMPAIQHFDQTYDCYKKR